MELKTSNKINEAFKFNTRKDEVEVLLSNSTLDIYKPLSFTGLLTIVNEYFENPEDAEDWSYLDESSWQPERYLVIKYKLRDGMETMLLVDYVDNSINDVDGGIFFSDIQVRYEKILEPEVISILYNRNIKALGLENEGSSAVVNIRTPDVLDALSRYDDSNYDYELSGRYAVSCLEDPYKDMYFYDGCSFQDARYCDDFSFGDDVKKKLTELGYQASTYKQLYNLLNEKDEIEDEEKASNRAKLKEAILIACDTGYEVGTSNERESAIINAIEKSFDASITFRFDDIVTISITREQYIKLLRNELSDNLSEDAFVIFENNGEFLDSFEYGFECSEPRYGWYSFDPEAFQERLEEEILGI